MKREFVIAGVFLIAVLLLLTGITFIGGESPKSTNETLSLNDALPTQPIPAPTAAPALPEENAGESVDPVAVAASSSESTANVQAAANKEYWVAGYVTGEDNRVLSGATVYVHSLDGMSGRTSFNNAEGNIGSAVTDDKGYYTIHVDGPHEIHIRCEPPEGYLSLNERGSITEEKSNLIQHFVHPLAPFKVRGRVIDAQKKTPIAGAKVAIIMDGRNRHPKQTIEQTISKADGSFEIPRLAQGTFRLEARADGYVDFLPYGKTPMERHPLRGIEVNAKTQDKEYVIEMEPGRAVTFYVVNPEGKPVSKAQIKITRNTDYFDYVGRCVTGADGSVVNDKLPDEPLLAEASHDKEGKGYSGTFKPGTPDAPEKVVIKLESGASVSGKVVDSEGNPVPGRQVVAEFRSLENWTKYPNESADPAGDGSYSIENLAPGSYQMFLVKKNYYPRRALAEKTVELQAGEVKTGVDFILGTEDSTTLKGRVIDEESKEPVEGVHVFATVSDKGGNLGTEGGQTDEKGEFKIFGAPKGGEKIQFSLQDKKGYAHTIHSRPANQDYYEMTITRSGTIRGVVLDSNDEPVEAAKVYPVRFFPNSRNPMEYFAITTAADGVFEFADLNPQNYSFCASAEGYKMTESDIVKLSKGETIDNVVIRLEIGAEVSGVVVDPQGQPVPDALISIYSNISNNNQNRWSTGFDPQNFPENARSDAAGAFTILDFPPNGDVLVVQHEKLAPVKFKITQDMVSQSPFTIQMKAGGSIVGTVYDSKNQGRANVQLVIQNYPENLFRYEAHTDDEGNYRIDNLASYSYMVLCNAPIEGPASSVDSGGTMTGTVTVRSGGGGGIGDQQYRTVTVQEGGETQCDFGGGEGAVLSGIVYKRGQVEPGALLEMRKQRGGGVIGDSLKTRADAQGAYSFQALKEGTYLLMASDRNAEDIDDRKCEFSTSVEVVAEQQEYHVDVHIASLEIQGVVVDEESGEPVSGVRIQARSGPNSMSYNKLSRLDATTGSEGKFNLSLQEDGNYKFVAMVDGYKVKEFDVSVPPTVTGQTAQPVIVQVKMEKDEIGVLVRLIYEGKPASTGWAYLRLSGGGYSPQNLLVIPQTGPGVYRGVGMYEGEFELTVTAYCYAQVLNTRPQQVTFRSGETVQLELNLYEIVNYIVTLRTPDNKTLEGTATFDTLDFPDDPPQEMAVMTEPERGWYNRGVLNIPADVRQVRLTFPGYQPLVFDPKASAQESPEGEKSILLDLKGSGVEQ